MHLFNRQKNRTRLKRVNLSILKPRQGGKGHSRNYIDLISGGCPSPLRQCWLKPVQVFHFSANQPPPPAKNHLVFKCRNNYKTDMHASQTVCTCFITVFVTVSIFISGQLKRNFRFTTSKDTIIGLDDNYSTALYTTLPTLCPTLYSPRQVKMRITFTFKLQWSSVYEKCVCDKSQFNYLRIKSIHRTIHFIILLGIIPSGLWRN